MRKIIHTFLTIVLMLCTINVIQAVNVSGMKYPYSLDRSTWSAVANSYQNLEGDSDGPASNLLDGNTRTTWHTAYDKDAALDVREFPFYVKIKFSDDLTKTETFSAFKYLTRQDSNLNGNIKNYELYISTSTEDLDFTSGSWQLIYTGSFSDKENEVDLGQMYSATQIQLKAISSQNGNSFAGGSEFELYRDQMNIVSIPSSQMTLSVSGHDSGDSGAPLSGNDLFDDNPETYWTSAGGNDLSDDYLEITLTNETVINQVNFTDRYNNGNATQWKCTGNMRNYIIQTKIDGEDWKVVSAGKTFDDEGYTSKGDGGTTRVKFAPVLAKYIKITCTESYHWQAANLNKYMTISELEVYGASNHMSMPSEPVMTYHNVAKGKSVTAFNTSDGSNPGGNEQRPLSMITDGISNDVNNYGELGRDNTRVSKYVQIDLEKVYTTIQKLHMHRYWSSNRVYDATVIQVAESLNENGDLNNPITIYNSDSENVHQLSDLPEATELYAESSAGKEFAVPENTPIKYIRVYVYGVNDGGTTDHIVELQAIVENIEKYNSDLVAYKEAKKTYYDKADVIYGFESDYAGYVRESRYSSVAPANITSEEVEANNQKEEVLATDGSFVKYVTDKVLSVKVQTYPENDKIYAKFVSSVPSLNLNKVKFKIKISSVEDIQERESVKVYTKLNTNYGTDITTPKEAFNNNASEYFFTVKLNGIPNDYTGTITVTPCWQPYGEDGVWIDGISRTFKVSKNTLVDAE